MLSHNSNHYTTLPLGIFVQLQQVCGWIFFAFTWDDSTRPDRKEQTNDQELDHATVKCPSL